MVIRKDVETGNRTDPQDAHFPETSAIREELERVLESRQFRSSKRGKDFLRYIVEQTLTGHEELLKERLIGAQLFNRASDYATGEDPVVRVQAGDVRRRLESYLADKTHKPTISIEIPVGSYIPIFHSVSGDGIAPSNVGHRTTPLPNLQAVSEEPGFQVSTAPAAVRAESLRSRRSNGARKYWLPLFISVVLIACFVGYWSRHRHSQDGGALTPDTSSAMLSQAFWEPLLSSPKPILVCIGRIAVYRPTPAFYERYAKSHPGELLSENDRLTRNLLVSPPDFVKPKDFSLAANSGLSTGAVDSVIDLSTFLAQMNKPFGVRLGVESSFADLRDSPAVLVGAFSNRWTLQMTSGLHFEFSEVSGKLSIRENVPSGRQWSWEVNPFGVIVRDYALITREHVSKAGQAVLSVAGIGDSGSEAASEMVTRPDALAVALRTLPRGWEKKNLQLVVVTEITDGKSGPPQLVASYIW